MKLDWMKSDQTPCLLSSFAPSGLRPAKSLETFGFSAIDGFKGCGARARIRRARTTLDFALSRAQPARSACLAFDTRLAKGRYSSG
jgi:hypothetical protein